MRDEETVHTALSAAETGHLVFSTVHTVDAAETVNRLIDFFPDGSSCFGGVVVDVWGTTGETLPANHVAVSDLATGKLVYLYVYPVTSFIKETYVEASM